MSQRYRQLARQKGTRMEANGSAQQQPEIPEGSRVSPRTRGLKYKVATIIGRPAQNPEPVFDEHSEDGWEVVSANFTTGATPMGQPVPMVIVVFRRELQPGDQLVLPPEPIKERSRSILLPTDPK